MTWRSFAPKLLLALASCGVLAGLLAAAEAVARRWDPHYLTRTRGLFVYSPVYGWAGRPHAVGLTGGASITLDAQGYRGRTLSEQPRRGIRVAVLGDSIASGYGVSDEQPFAWLLDVRDNGIETANLAVEGYGLGQELLVLKREALQLEPDVVLLAVCLRNDFVDSALPVALYDGVTPRPVFRLENARPVLDDTPIRRSAAGRSLQWLVDHSHLWNLASSLLPRRAAAQERSWRHRKREVLQDEERAFALTLALVREMDGLCRRRGIPLLVATFPNGLSYDMKPGMQQRLHAALAEDGTWFLDMRSEFRERGWQAAELALDDVGHLTPRGHAVSSEILEREILERRPSRP